MQPAPPVPPGASHPAELMPRLRLTPGRPRRSCECGERDAGSGGCPAGGGGWSGFCPHGNHPQTSPTHTLPETGTRPHRVLCHHHRCRWRSCGRRGPVRHPEASVTFPVSHGEVSVPRGRLRICQAEPDGATVRATVPPKQLRCYRRSPGAGDGGVRGDQAAAGAPTALAGTAVTPRHPKGRRGRRRPRCPPRERCCRPLPTATGPLGSRSPTPTGTLHRAGKKPRPGELGGQRGPVGR